MLDADQTLMAGRGPALALLAVHVLIGALGAALGTLLAVFALTPAMFSAMIFDHPNASEVVWTVLLGLGVLSLPFVLFGAAILGTLPILLSLLGLGLRKVWPSLVGIALTLLIFALPLVNVVLISVGAAGLEVYCDGEFGCTGP
ncbi:MAG: hypothetical protein EA397_14380 [Deltaproteobacteria bacterium]|nr:MAG: hypothetical protein EA397_14380 [Deltaproteobacteria bacterium]